MTPAKRSLDLTDPWAEVEVQAEERRMAEVQAKINADARQVELRAKRWDSIWNGVGILFGMGILATILISIALMMYRSGDANKNKELELQRERTQQITACTRLENPAERQLCIISLNIPPAEEER